MKKVLVVGLSVCLMSLLLTGCGSSGNTTKDTTPIKIGLSTPLTGNFAENGEGTKVAVQMAVDKINAAGGINGRTIEVDVQDSKSDPTQSAQIATMFTEDDSILAEIGDFSSGACIAAAPIYEEAGMVQLSPTASNPDFTKQGEYMFSIFGKTTDESNFVAKYLLKKYMKAENIAVIYVNSDWGVQAFENLQGLCADNKLNLVASEDFFDGEKDFSAVLTKIRQTNPDTIMLLMGYDAGAVAIKQIKQMNWDVQVAISGLAYSEQLITLGGDSVEGVLSEIGFVIDDTDPEMKAFADEFTEKAGFSPNMMMTCAYDAVNMLAEAMKNCKTLDRASIRDALENTHGFVGLTGPNEFDENRMTSQKNFKIVTIENGAWKVLTDTDYID